MERLTGDPKRHDISEFSQGLQGHCLCGSVHVTINDTELFTRQRGHICHCSNCRKISGSYASINLIIEEEKVQIEDRDGTLTKFIDRETMSGNPLERWFCSRCGKSDGLTLYTQECSNVILTSHLVQSNPSMTG
ncbi:Mss4-like protein [Xylariales sp. PMI_506]|nr:Mss4-like protein [Xylariales sp. PMI_506]